MFRRSWLFRNFDWSCFDFLLFFARRAAVDEVVRLTVHLLSLRYSAVSKFTLSMNPLLAVFTLNPLSAIISLFGVFVVYLVTVVTELIAFEGIGTSQAELMSDTSLG